MLLSEFSYELPNDRVAKSPVFPRDHSKMMVVYPKERTIEHRYFYDIVDYLRPSDILVINDSRVIPARFFGSDAKGRTCEVLLLPKSAHLNGRWEALIRPGSAKSPITLGGDVTVHWEGKGPGVTRPVELTGIPEGGLLEWLNHYGQIPIPPYLKREANASDSIDYQTVYASKEGSVACPTAGLHFTQDLLAKIRQRGTKIVCVTLHVGYGTFSPIRESHLENHQMHTEFLSLTESVYRELQDARSEGRRIFAVGTTSLRALESLPEHGELQGGAAQEGRIEGETHLFIYPGYAFRWVSGLITNFHLPKTSLFVLVASLLGTDFAKYAYEEAIRRRYRFYSYGDSMLIIH